ncbi:hypothetical protein [Telmatospirillum siberiense]|uniref:Uncharacterized protein n=1 Tax=Telmatospirillum siberiense TaxID=382514 RepID=A0A2N3PVC5_9PROT|nr:hypothetical protein [Telmatospirillum siberiense]PKU24349.1 hypothetical protein CWS72_12210 [Telmatospirillum siberiense]
MIGTEAVRFRYALLTARPAIAYSIDDGRIEIDNDTAYDLATCVSSKDVNGSVVVELLPPATSCRNVARDVALPLAVPVPPASASSSMVIGLLLLDVPLSPACSRSNVARMPLVSGDWPPVSAPAVPDVVEEEEAEESLLLVEALLCVSALACAEANCFCSCCWASVLLLTVKDIGILLSRQAALATPKMPSCKRRTPPI